MSKPLRAEVEEPEEEERLAPPIKVQFSVPTLMMLDLYRTRRGTISREAGIRKLVEAGLALENARG